MVGISGVLACGIENSTIIIKKIVAKHHYVITIVRVNGDEVLIEQLLESFLDNKSILSRVDLPISGGILHVCHLRLIIRLNPITFILLREDMESLKTDQAVSQNKFLGR